MKSGTEGLLSGRQAMARNLKCREEGRCFISLEKLPIVDGLAEYVPVMHGSTEVMVSKKYATPIQVKKTN